MALLLCKFLIVMNEQGLRNPTEQPHFHAAPMLIETPSHLPHSGFDHVAKRQNRQPGGETILLALASLVSPKCTSVLALSSAVTRTAVTRDEPPHRWRENIKWKIAEAEASITQLSL